MRSCSFRLVAVISDTTIPAGAATAPGVRADLVRQVQSAGGSSPDPAKWKFETGGNGWGSKELEHYTSRLRNARIRDGKLEIIGRKEGYTGPDGVKRDYTSARLITSGKFDQAYGSFEARIKVSYGQGVWPAFWLLGADDKQVGWPTCGEIDIVENIGRDPAVVQGTIDGRVS